MSTFKPKTVSTASILAGAWFAFGLLVVLALGFLLIGILTNWQDWLAENWSLTFPSLLPPFYWYLFAAVPALVILLYFLKLKRKSLHVPSTFLWRKSIEDLHVNSLFQWLRRNMLLVLQLLVLMGLGYALASPTHNSEAKGRHIILMLDNSASMNATDETPTRFDFAKAEAKKRIDALDPSDQAMIIAFNSEAQILCSYTNRHDELHRAIDRIEPTHRKTQFEHALALAEGQANPRTTAESASMPPPEPGGMPRETVKPEGISTDVFVFTDGRFSDVSDFALGKLKLNLVRVGKSGHNLGIVRVDLRRDDEQPDRYEVAVQVLNFETKAVEERVAVQLEVFARNSRTDRQSQVVGVQPLLVQESPPDSSGRKKRSEIPGITYRAAKPGEKQRPGLPFVLFNVKDPGPGYLRVSLIDQNTGDPWRDELALDNVAWLAIAPVRKARILRIGPPNDILDAMLGAVQSQQRAAVTVLPPMGFATDQRYQAAVNGESYDLVFFDRCAPPRMEEMPQANTFFIGSVPPSRPNLWDAMTPMKDVLAKEFLHSHPMLRGIETMQGMSVAEARAFPKDQLPPRASALIETNQEPILWAIGRQRFTDLVMTFPLVVEGEAGRQGWNTNWPKQPVGAFPLFFDNVVTQLGRFQEYEKSIVPGVQKPLDPGEAVNEVDIKLLDPPGDFTLKSVRQNNQELSCCPERVGLYNVSWAGAVRYRFAANLFDRDESNIQPRDDFMVGEEEVKKTQEALPQRWPLWPWFVLAALVILMVEWWIYNARIHA